jgi:hypothetical protein
MPDMSTLPKTTQDHKDAAFVIDQMEAASAYLPIVLASKAGIATISEYQPLVKPFFLQMTRARIRKATPEPLDPRRIREMLTAFSWVTWIDSPIIQNVVIARSLRRSSGRPIMWTELAKAFRCSENAVKLRHAAGIAMIVAELSR